MYLTSSFTPGMTRTKFVPHIFIHTREKRTIPTLQETRGHRVFSLHCTARWRLTPLDEQCEDHITGSECERCLKLSNSLDDLTTFGYCNERSHVPFWVIQLDDYARLTRVTSYYYDYKKQKSVKISTIQGENISEQEFSKFRATSQRNVPLVINFPCNVM